MRTVLWWALSMMTVIGTGAGLYGITEKIPERFRSVVAIIGLCFMVIGVLGLALLFVPVFRRWLGSLGRPAKAPLLEVVPLPGGGYTLDWLYLDRQLTDEQRRFCREWRLVFAAVSVHNRGAVAALDVKAKISVTSDSLHWTEERERALTPEPGLLRPRTSDGVWSREPGQLFVLGGGVEENISAGSDRLLVFAVGFRTLRPNVGSWWLVEPGDLLAQKALASRDETLAELVRSRFLGTPAVINLRVNYGGAQIECRFELKFQLDSTDGQKIKPYVKPTPLIAPPSPGTSR